MIAQLRAALVALSVAVFGCGPSASPPANTSDLPGVDTSSLDPREKRELQHYLTTFLAPCADVAVPVGQCVAEKRACDKCAPAAQFLAQAVKDGLAPAQIEARYRDAYDPAGQHTIAEDGATAKGPTSAKVTLVEFADFECPGCKALMPILDDIAERYANDVRVVFKFYPLEKHQHAEAAARAAVAAMWQGKFWEMHHLLFQNQNKLEDRDLEGYATKLGLDVPRFLKDLASDKAGARVMRDRAEGDKLGIESTPSLYVNGRLFDLAHGGLEAKVKSLIHGE